MKQKRATLILANLMKKSKNKAYKTSFNKYFAKSDERHIIKKITNINIFKIAIYNLRNMMNKNKKKKTKKKRMTNKYKLVRIVKRTHNLPQVVNNNKNQVKAKRMLI